jgi:hypothetical protein
MTARKRNLAFPAKDVRSSKAVSPPRTLFYVHLYESFIYGAAVSPELAVDRCFIVLKKAVGTVGRLNSRIYV